jgi:hypothetical protein
MASTAISPHGRACVGFADRLVDLGQSRRSRLDDFVDRLREEEPVLLVRRRNGAVVMNDLPLAVLEVQHTREPVLDGSSTERRIELRQRASPADRPLAHRVNLVAQAPCERPTHVSHVLDQDAGGRLTVVPHLVGIGAEPLEAGLVREADPHGLLVAVA